ncbi:hypothetical protein [Povalibacter sp.]|uniref:hypothetical protein n=1 Tax=Povalibacter sp. TaxID=1962978 RepID=UPI002F42580E
MRTLLPDELANEIDWPGISTVVGRFVPERMIEERSQGVGCLVMAQAAQFGADGVW